MHQIIKYLILLVDIAFQLFVYPTGSLLFTGQHQQITSLSSIRLLRLQGSSGIQVAGMAGELSATLDAF